MHVCFSIASYMKPGNVIMRGIVTDDTTIAEVFENIGQ